MIARGRVGHAKSHHDLVNNLRADAGQISGLPIALRGKDQFVFCGGIDLIFGDVADQAPRFIHCGVEQGFAGGQIAQADGNAARMCAINAVQRMGRHNCHYSIDALSRLSEVAATIGLITPRHLTLTQAVLPLAMARRGAAQGWGQLRAVLDQLAMPTETFEH